MRGGLKFLPEWVPSVESLIVQLFNVAVAHSADVFELPLGNYECLIDIGLCLINVGLIEMRAVSETSNGSFGKIVEFLDASLFVGLGAMFHQLTAHFGEFILLGKIVFLSKEHKKHPLFRFSRFIYYNINTDYSPVYCIM